MKKTFKDFLLEQQNVIKKWDVTPLSNNQAVDYLLKNSKSSFIKALKNGGLLFRGFKEPPAGEGMCAVIDPSTGKRTSKDTDNLYQLMMDESESLADYPSRSKSLICATRPNPATMYGEVYAVIPKNDSKICYILDQDILDISLTDEIWKYSKVGPLSYANISAIKQRSITRFLSGFNNGREKFKDAKMLNERMSKFTDDELCAIFLSTTEDILEYFKSRFETFDPEFYKDFYKKIEYIYSSGQMGRIGSSIENFNNAAKFSLDFEDIQKHEQLIRDLGKFIARIENSKAGGAVVAFRNLLRGLPSDKRFTSISTMLMTPGSLGLILGKFGDKLERNSECWTDSECLVIPIETFSLILNESRELDLVDSISDINKRYRELINYHLLRAEDES